MTFTTLLLLAQIAFSWTSNAKIDRRKVVEQFNPIRHSSSNSTPAQVGNGNFAFGADVTGLQTFLPYATLSSWGWHNFTLPTTPGQTQISDFTGLDWWTHGRLVNYNQPNPAEPDISNWLIQNPQRINLGRLGFWFGGQNVSEADLSGTRQKIDLFTGGIRSRFTYNGSKVAVEVFADPNADTVAVKVKSPLLSDGSLGFFLDYPYPDVNKFDAPFVGVFNQTSLHTTTLTLRDKRAVIQHDLDETTYYTNVAWSKSAEISRPLESRHRYILQSSGTNEIELIVNYGLSNKPMPTSFDHIAASSKKWWKDYWESGAFIDLTAADDDNAIELQRRTILSQYLLAVNEAGHDFPQESGLVNNGWYGKFHLEMVFWHLGHWARWGKWALINRSMGVYKRFLPSSIKRAQDQGYTGARWGKMSDPTGRSAPGEINSLLIWQQPHPFYFAELEYRAFPTAATLEKWDEVLSHSAEFMASYAFWNQSTQSYMLGPPMYPVSENTNPNATLNPTFELAYWRFGLDVAAKWKSRQGKSTPKHWTHVAKNLAPLPVVNETYPIYEGIPNMWTDPTTVDDHPAMSGIYGLLPPTPGVNVTIVQNTADKIATTWNLADSYGWDFPMLAMNSVRLGDIDQAVSYLLDSNFEFDDVGMPVGGTRVPTPYFPASGSFLLAMAMMAGGWDGAPGSHFPESWNAAVEGFTVGL